MNKDYRIIETANNEFKIQKRLFGDITSNTLMEGTWRETAITILDGELKGQIFKGKT